jgi:hypothetical protein
MNPTNFDVGAVTRRAFLGRSAGGLGALALAHLMGRGARASGSEGSAAGLGMGMAPDPTLPRPRAKAVISLFQHGGPSQMDLFDC